MRSLSLDFLGGDLKLLYRSMVVTDYIFRFWALYAQNTVQILIYQIDVFMACPLEQKKKQLGTCSKAPNEHNYIRVLC